MYVSFFFFFGCFVIVNCAVYIDIKVKQHCKKIMTNKQRMSDHKNINDEQTKNKWYDIKISKILC